MNAREHLIIGLIVSAIVFAILVFLGYISFAISNLIIISILSILFCLLPDIDHKSGTATWAAFGVGLLLIIIAVLNIPIPFIGSSKIIMFYGIILLVFTFCAAEFIGHRQFIHSIIFGLIAAGSLYFLFYSWQLCLIAFASFYSHLCADSIPLKLI